MMPNPKTPNNRLFRCPTCNEERGSWVFPGAIVTCGTCHIAMTDMTDVPDFAWSDEAVVAVNERLVADIGVWDGKERNRHEH